MKTVYQETYVFDISLILAKTFIMSLSFRDCLSKTVSLCMRVSEAREHSHTDKIMAHFSPRQNTTTF